MLNANSLWIKSQILDTRLLALRKMYVVKKLKLHRDKNSKKYLGLQHGSIKLQALEFSMNDASKKMFLAHFKFLNLAYQFAQKVREKSFF